MNIFDLVKSDLYRYQGKVSFLIFIKSLFFVKGFKFTFWMRLSKHFLKYPVLKFIPRLFHYYYKRVYCSDIGFRHDIGVGFSLYHVFNTAFCDGVKIGNNVTITHGVTIGHVQGKAPVLLNNIYVGPGACILGGITIGNNAVIGANAVVIKDIPDNAIVVGNPSRIISYKGAEKTLQHPFPIN
jgi:serine O-acetyltransferase